MAPSFKGVLSCTQIKIFSKVMIECASDLEGMLCFVPIHCLPTSSKKKVEMAIKEGLLTVTKKAESKKWNGKKEISAAMQDLMDPFLGAVYNTFSISVGYTDPYQEYATHAIDRIKFTVDVSYIPEGENDTCKLELLLHSNRDIVFFIWKVIGKYRSHLCLRYEKFTWSMDITNGSVFTLEYDKSANNLTANGNLLEKTVGWPLERKTSSELIKEANSKMKKNIKRLSYKTYKWIEKVPTQYLNSMDIGLDDRNEDGIGLLHILTQMNDRKALKCILGKIKDIDIVNRRGESALHIACSKGFYKIAKSLIEMGSNVNSVTKSGDTPLTLLVANNNVEIEMLKLLLACDVNTEHANDENMRAIDIAKERRADKKIIALLQPHLFTS